MKTATFMEKKSIPCSNWIVLRSNFSKNFFGPTYFNPFLKTYFQSDPTQSLSKNKILRSNPIQFGPNQSIPFRIGLNEKDRETLSLSLSLSFSFSFSFSLSLSFSLFFYLTLYLSLSLYFLSVFLSYPLSLSLYL